MSIFIEFSPISNQNSSSAFSHFSFLFPAIMAALTPPIEVPAIISNLILFFVSAL